MKFLKRQRVMLRRQLSPTRFAIALLAGGLIAVLSACSGSVNIPTSTASGPQVYMSPVIAGIPAGIPSATANLATYSIDDAAETFSQDTYVFTATQSGAQVNYSGVFVKPPLQRGLIGLDLTYAYGPNPVGGVGGWAFELPGQSGGLLQLMGQPFVPLVPAVTCPSMSSAQTFLFVTLPAALQTTGNVQALAWDPQIETAFGSTDISASGTTVTLSNIQQYTLPSVGTAEAPANPSPPSVTGICSSTYYGNTVGIPAQLTISNPGNGEKVPAQATFGIGPSGLLVENNGSYASSSPVYQNALGAGTGAIGLPKPSSSVDTSALVGAQYLGFFYGSGNSNTNWSSEAASFGFSSQPASCTSLAPQTSTILYGGDFPGNDPSAAAVQASGGYGNCDFAIDLGAQSTATNGLYPSATVYVGSGFGKNITTYSFPAVAIAGQLNGKYAVFLIGVDTVGSPNQAWGIYLLQSN
jgi:hypothetical protein